MQKEKLICTKVYKVLEAIMKVQAGVMEEETLIKLLEENECFNEEINQMKESVEKEKNEVLDIYSKNNVTIEEIKEISEVLNYGEQMIMEEEEQLGTNLVMPMNIHNGRRAKIRKLRVKGKCWKKRKSEIRKVVREILGRPRMPNK
jgi:beta-lactamase class D